MLSPENGDPPPLVIEAAAGSYMYGPVLALTSTTADSFETLEYLESIFRTGYASLMRHNRLQSNVRTVKGIMRLTTRTGVQQPEKKKQPPSSRSLATIFELESERAPKLSSPEGHRPHTLSANVVARAVIAYRDASGWPSVGPTILSIEVRRDYQGSGLVQDLFNAIERYACAPIAAARSTQSFPRKELGKLFFIAARFRKMCVYFPITFLSLYLSLSLSLSLSLCVCVCGRICVTRGFGFRLGCYNTKQHNENMTGVQRWPAGDTCGGVDGEPRPVAGQGELEAGGRRCPTNGSWA